VEDFYARAVFFVADGERALKFYTEKLGFTVEWNHQVDGRAYVCEVSLHGFSLILNEDTTSRIGQGRVFLGLEDDQMKFLRKHIADRGIETTTTNWGQPTMVITDLDGNEIYCWPG
jgi:catechol 2,3-dioxygenase-like lactoylglutathione lyase family enzyme